MLRKIIFSLLFLGIGVGGFLYLLKTKPPNAPAKVTEKSWAVDTQVISLRSLSPSLTLYGQVESPHTAALKAALNAEVMAVQVLEGEQAQKKQLLIELDDSEARLSVEQRQADLAEIEAGVISENNTHATHQAALPREKTLLQLAQKAVERAAKLEKRQVGSQSSLDESRSAVARQQLAVGNRQLEIKNHASRLAQLKARQKRAQAMLGLAKLDLERTRITAPFSGVISSVQVSPGDRVRPGDALLEMYETDMLEVRVHIPSDYQGVIEQVLSKGQSLQALAHSHSGEQAIQLALHRLAGKIKPDSASIEALFRIEDQAQAALLRLGAFMTLRLILPPQEGVAPIPFESLYGRQTVYKIADGRMLKADVQFVGEYVSPAGEKLALVRGPVLQTGDRLIITQLPNAVEGLKVTPRQDGEQGSQDDDASP